MENLLIDTQIKIINEEKEAMRKEIRQLKIILDDLRVENSKIIEELTIPKPKKCDFGNALLFCSDWMTSAAIFKIIELKSQVHELEKCVSNQDSEMLDHLKDELKKLEMKKEQLMNAKSSLEEEYSQLIEESNKEKEELKSFLNIKT